MNYNTNNNHGDKSVNLNSFTRRDIIHRENTFVKNELSWNKPKEMFNRNNILDIILMVLIIFMM